jgi:hypothetical protein
MNAILLARNLPTSNPTGSRAVDVKMSTSKRQMMGDEEIDFVLFQYTIDYEATYAIDRATVRARPEHNPLAVARMVYVRPALWGRLALRHPSSR